MGDIMSGIIQKNEPVLLGDILPEVMRNIDARIAAQKAATIRATAAGGAREFRRRRKTLNNRSRIRSLTVHVTQDGRSPGIRAEV